MRILSNNDNIGKRLKYQVCMINNEEKEIKPENVMSERKWQ